MTSPAIHRVFLNTASRVSGTAYNALIPIHIPNLLDPEKINCVGLETTSTFSNATPIDLYVGSATISQPYTYSSLSNGENTIIEKIPYIWSDGTAAYHATFAQDNLPNTSTNLVGILRSNQINIIRLVKKHGTLASIYTGDWALTLAFYQSDVADITT